ncbi:hypothetical protein T01_8606 [Trichinella spiralis]|uniref:Uncharacterized protein n=1 Tax=Trichinella spiralis TaxID=6334 RepID=A0A0V1ALQ3_TRISP|nr:hypothetical protein T01_8606 [Trichinella spiralis]
MISRICLCQTLFAFLVSSRMLLQLSSLTKELKTTKLLASD